MRAKYYWFSQKRQGNKGCYASVSGLSNYLISYQYNREYTYLAKGFYIHYYIKCVNGILLHRTSIHTRRYT